MARTILITGASSGMGRATAARLRDKGDRVIGVARAGQEIEADLATPDGRAHMLSEAARLAPKGLDGVVAAAGIADAERSHATVALNYFGAVATLEGLRPLLAKSKRPRAVAISSTAAFLPTDENVVTACLGGDEPGALRAAETSASCYPDSKRALSLWLRRTAPHRDWAGSGILLNGVAPGVVETSLNETYLADPQWSQIIRQINPIAVDGYAKPEEVAELIDFLLGFESHYLLGQIISIDGGTDAITRADMV